MKYTCLIVGALNTICACCLVGLAAQTSMTDEILWVFALNAVFAVLNVGAWFVFRLTEFFDERSGNFT